MTLRRRSLALALVVALILALGLVIKWLPGDWTLTTAQKGVMGVVPVSEPAGSAPVRFDRDQWRLSSAAAARGEGPAAAQTRILFEHALALMQQGRLAETVKALELLISVAPRLPEAYVNLGFTLYELAEYNAARAAFGRAIDLNPGQGNAYYGAAICYEALGDLPLALGAMRTFLHVTEGQEQFKARARAAIWEWESRLGRDPAAPSPPASAAAAASSVSG